jgi:RNA polymerase sigma factor (sigma-70 family)
VARNPTTQSGAPGSPESFGDLYIRCFGDMVRLARVLVDSQETAEDLVQDAFVRLHRRWGGVREPRPYLHRCVVNACRSHHRRAWRERTRLGRETGWLRPHPARPDGVVDRGDSAVTSGGVSEEARADDADALSAALATLSYRQRAALVLRFYADLPDAEIAVALGCRSGTVASLVHRGLDHLRGVLRDDP